MRLVILESPYAGDVERNVAYARACMRDSLDRGEAPFASHLLYTQVLDDGDEMQRLVGKSAGWSWMNYAQLVAVYNDLGVSEGMREGISEARLAQIPVVIRQLGGEWSE